MATLRQNAGKRNELECLRSRLAEAEETLNAIRRGEVDAIAVEGPNGRQIYTLQTPDRPYQTFTESMSEGAASLTREGTIIFCNGRLAEMVGHAQEKLLGSPATILVAPAHKKRFQQLLSLGKQNLARAEIQFLRGDGSTISVLVSLKPILSELSPGICLIATDLTDRNRAEEALKAERQRFEAILDALPTMICLLTPNYDVRFANHAFRKQFGEPQGRKCHDCCFGQAAPCAFCESFEVLKTSKSHDWEVMTRDNRCIHAFDFPFTDVDGSPLVLEMDLDITEQRVAEEEIRALNRELEERVRDRTAELEAANKELEAFSYSVSHDLRAPLRHISGFSKVLSEEFGPQLPEEAQHHVQRIQEGTLRMGQLIEDLLNLSRVGRHELRCQAASLENIVRQVLSDLQPECGGRAIQWKVGKLPLAECDEALLKQVFQNLLSNALKFTRRRQKAVIEIGCTEQQGIPAIFVRDNGVGFNMKYAGKLFGVFQRMHRVEDFEGTGVGLATVQRIVQKHGGRVWAEAELDKGATFYFTLAALDKTHQEPATHEEVAHAFAVD